MANSQECFYLGEGYRWGPGITQICMQILRMPHDDIPKPPEWLPSFIKNAFIPKNVKLDKLPVETGAPWIRALSSEIKPVLWPFKSAEGHTLVAGTTGAGKTRTYELISTQIIRLGSVLIIVDPKNDKDWRNRVEKECKKIGRKFLYFQQAQPSKSIRLNPLANWNQSTEIATRISQLLEEGPFRSFAHDFIDRVVNGLLYVGERPNLRLIFNNIQGTVDSLLQRCLVKYFVDNNYEQYEMKARGAAGKGAQVGLLDGLVNLYTEHIISEAKSDRHAKNEAIDGLIATFKHDRDHYSRIIATLLPLLQMLTTGEVGKILSPDINDIHDTREIWDTKTIIEKDAVLYVGMDSLSNSEVAKAINSMILAEVASVAGEIYNFVEEEDRKTIFVIIDEVAEAINEQVIQILNKGRGAGFRAFVALQTIKDLEAKLQSPAKMLQVLGNLNNQIVLRLEDVETVKWIVEKIGETAIGVLNKGRSQGTGTEQHLFEFSGNITKSVKSEKTSLVPKEVFLGLSNLQYIARFTGGYVTMGTIPIIQG